MFLSSPLPFFFLSLFLFSFLVSSSFSGGFSCFHHLDPLFPSVFFPLPFVSLLPLSSMFLSFLSYFLSLFLFSFIFSSCYIGGFSCSNYLDPLFSSVFFLLPVFFSLVTYIYCVRISLFFFFPIVLHRRFSLFSLPRPSFLFCLFPTSYILLTRYLHLLTLTHFPLFSLSFLTFLLFILLFSLIHFDNILLPFYTISFSILTFLSLFFPVLDTVRFVSFPRLTF